MKTIGIIGTGELGTALALRFQNSHNVLVYNRTPANAKNLLDQGIALVAVDELIQKSDLILLALFDKKAIDETVLPVLEAAANKPFVCISSTTTEEAKELNQNFARSGAHFFDCALFSGVAEVSAGQARTLLSGNKAGFQSIQSDLAVFSSDLRYIDEIVGHASSIETACAQILYFQVSSYALALAVAEKDQVPLETLTEILQQSPLINAPMFPLYAAHMTARSYDNPILWKIGNMSRTAKMIEAHLSSIGVGQKMFSPIAEMLATLCQDSALKDKNFTAIFEAVRSKES